MFGCSHAGTAYLFPDRMHQWKYPQNLPSDHKTASLHWSASVAFKSIKHATPWTRPRNNWSPFVDPGSRSSPAASLQTCNPERKLTFLADAGTIRSFQALAASRLDVAQKRQAAHWNSSNISVKQFQHTGCFPAADTFHKRRFRRVWDTVLALETGSSWKKRWKFSKCPCGHTTFVLVDLHEVRWKNVISFLQDIKEYWGRWEF